MQTESYFLQTFFSKTMLLPTGRHCVLTSAPHLPLWYPYIHPEDGCGIVKNVGTVAVRNADRLQYCKNAEFEGTCKSMIASFS
jgi:hypothetical protein